ncbi:MAG: hypothetical protein OHK0046_46460 [Anaerolineae bacterium]
MFHKGLGHQNVADFLKGLAERAPAIASTEGAAQKERAAILKRIQDFESLDWHAGMFEDALATILPASFTIQGNDLIFDEAGTEMRAITAIRFVLDNYKEMQTGRPLLFDATAAGEHMGLTARTIRSHVHESGKLTASYKGAVLLFTARDLFEFDRRRVKSGRPQLDGDQDSDAETIEDAQAN